MNLVEQVVGLHRALDDAEIPHAFGGALALAWCTQQARGTIDIDLNLFVSTSEIDGTLAAFPPGVSITDANRRELEADGQSRLWWGATPVDIFFNTTPFHEAAASRARIEHFGGAAIPFLACRDLAVFKAFFNRIRDWADLEDMNSAGTLDHEAVLGVLVRYIGGEDPRVARLRALADQK